MLLLGILALLFVDFCQLEIPKLYKYVLNGMGTGEVKYENLGMEYPLKGMEPLNKEDAIHAREVILDGARRRRKEDAANA